MLYARAAADEAGVYDPGEDTVIYYDTSSGDTHRLSRIAADIMAALAPGPLTLDALMQVLGDDSSGGNLLQPVLDELEALGLLRRLS